MGYVRPSALLLRPIQKPTDELCTSPNNEKYKMLDKQCSMLRGISWGSARALACRVRRPRRTHPSLHQPTDPQRPIQNKKKRNLPGPSGPTLQQQPFTDGTDVGQKRA